MLAELRERYPAVAIVVVSAMQERSKVIQALELGAVGYIPKSARREVTTSALQLVFVGGIYIPQEILVREEQYSAASPQSNDRPIVLPSEIGLSERQLEELAYLMQGRNNKVICRMAGKPFVYDDFRADMLILSGAVSL